jgi:hypothetical protein
MDGMENPCSLSQYGMGFPSLWITERLIPAHLFMLDEKECFFSFELRMAWVFLVISLGKPMPSLAQMRRVLHTIVLLVLLN